MLANSSENVQIASKKCRASGIRLSHQSNDVGLFDRLAKLSAFKLILLGIALASLLMLGLFAGLAGYHALISEDDPVRELINEMTEASEDGEVVKSDYAEIDVINRHGRLAVVARVMDKQVCSSVAWYFVHRGNVSINGTAPYRASLANLESLCKQGSTATLTWWPEASTQ